MAVNIAKGGRLPVLPNRNITMKELHWEITRHSQNVVYTSLVLLGQGRYKVRIVSNAYSDQSYAKIERWDGERWNLVHCIDGFDQNGLKTIPALYVHYDRDKTTAFSNFKADRERLVNFALLLEEQHG